MANEPGQILAFPESKRCPRCQEIKPLSEWTLRLTGPRKGQPVAHCNSCSNAAMKERKKRDPSLYDRIEWKSKLKRLYGITPEQYHEMLANQGGVCAICGTHKRRANRPTERLSVDHCHRTGRVRGLLCTRCNSALAFFDDAIFAEKVAVYLRATSSIGSSDHR